MQACVELGRNTSSPGTRVSQCTSVCAEQKEEGTPLCEFAGVVCKLCITGLLSVHLQRRKETSQPSTILSSSYDSWGSSGSLRNSTRANAKRRGTGRWVKNTPVCTCRHTPNRLSAAQACEDKPRPRQGPPFIPRGVSRDSRYSPSPRRCRWGRRSAAGPGSARCSWPRSHRSRWGCRGRRRARSDARR